MNYVGYRLKLNVQFEKMQDNIQIDIGVGDLVTPVQKSLALYLYREKPLFENSVSLQVYPIETIFAEKLETIISKGATNSRMKDYHDIILLCRNPVEMEASTLKTAIINTFKNRNTELLFPIVFDESDLNILQNQWNAHIKGLGDIVKKLVLPKNLRELISEINAYLNENEI